jgi:hypothetical protein
MKKKKTSSSNIIYGLGEGELDFQLQQERLAKSQVQVLLGKDDKNPTLAKSILNVLNNESEIHRLAFEVDPSQVNNFAGVYQTKLRLVPDAVLKRISIQDSLVATIVRTRQNHVSQFGRPRTERFSKGFVIRPNTGYLETLSPEEKVKFSQQVERAVKLFSTCGHTENVKTIHQNSLSEYLGLITRSGVVCGRIATEVVYAEEEGSGAKLFSHFVATDAGTIYRATEDRTGLEAIRKEAYDLLCRITGKKLVRENWNNDKYKWVQVIDGTPKQVFTDEEMRVYNLYPVPDVELNGYPVTPIDTVITAITTHINITTHNKLYFQSGRASRGMLTITGDDVNQNMIHNIKQQFNASINGCQSAWRMPVFGMPSGSVIQWQPIDTGGGRDMEFQYLSDQNAREIMSAFMMSPDELPGYSHLSRGTASQALSESNTEYKLIAARDVGIRPLLSCLEDYVNKELFPLIDADLCKKASFCLLGLDADTEEKEAVKLQTAAQVYYTYDDIMHKVEKRPMGKKWAGEIPLNPVYKTYLDQYFYVGDILEHLCGIEGASKDPNLHYIRDAYYFQNQQLIQAQQQMQMAQQNPQEPDPNNPNGAPSNPDGSKPTDQDKQAEANQKQIDQAQQNKEGPSKDQLGSAIGQAFDLMKAEQNLPPEKRKILAQHNKTIEFFMNGFKDDVKDGVKEILDLADKLGPHA